MAETTRDKRGSGGACPVCRRPTEARWRPFCSKRCADIDLGRWVSGGYRIPGEPVPEEDLPRRTDPEDDED